MQVKKWFLLCTLLGTNRSSPLTSVWLLYSLLLAYSLRLISSAMGSRSSKWFVNLMVSDDESGQVHEMFLAAPNSLTHSTPSNILWQCKHVLFHRWFSTNCTLFFYYCEQLTDLKMQFPCCMQIESHVEEDLISQLITMFGNSALIADHTQGNKSS